MKDHGFNINVDFGKLALHTLILRLCRSSGLELRPGHRCLSQIDELLPVIVPETEGSLPQYCVLIQLEELGLRSELDHCMPNGPYHTCPGNVINVSRL